MKKSWKTTSIFDAEKVGTVILFNIIATLLNTTFVAKRFPNAKKVVDWINFATKSNDSEVQAFSGLDVRFLEGLEIN